MSTPDSGFEDSGEIHPLHELIAVDRYVLSAGLVTDEDGVTPAVSFTMMGLLASQVGNPHAQRVSSAFLLRPEDARRFAAQLVQACDQRPSSPPTRR